MDLSKELDETSMKGLVDRFYAEARPDVLLGPIFNNTISDWPAQQERLAAFWSSVMLSSGRYKGQAVDGPRYLFSDTR